jgi:hypothetical protein
MKMSDFQTKLEEFLKIYATATVALSKCEPEIDVVELMIKITPFLKGYKELLNSHFSAMQNLIEKAEHIHLYSGCENENGKNVCASKIIKALQTELKNIKDNNYANR